MEDTMENRTKPSPSPRPLPRGEGEHANASSRLGECRLRSHAPKLGATAAGPSPARPNALAHSALPDEPSGSPSPVGRGRGEGEGISLSFTVFFSAVGSGLNSTENSEEPPGISLVDDAKASSSFVEQPASAAGGVLLGERVGVGECFFIFFSPFLSNTRAHSSRAGAFAKLIALTSHFPS